MAWRRQVPDRQRSDGEPEKDLNAAVTREIVKRREDEDMIRRDMYERIKMAKNTYLSREYQDRPWTVPELQAVAGVFGMEAWELLKAAAERPADDDDDDNPWVQAIGGD